MEKQGLPHRKIIYVCLNEREGKPCCAGNGSLAVHARLKEMVRSRGLSHHVRVSRSGCMDQCLHGPNVLVFPEGIWYSEVAESDCESLLDEVLGGIAPAP